MRTVQQTPLLAPGPVSDALADLAATAVGQAHREEPALPRTGGPAGNARLTAWTGLVLLLGFAVEGVTLVAMHQLISVHILVGALLVPPVLLKTATTGWRVVRYYLAAKAYTDAGRRRSSCAPSVRSSSVSPSPPSRAGSGSSSRAPRDVVRPSPSSASASPGSPSTRRSSSAGSS